MGLTKESNYAPSGYPAFSAAGMDGFVDRAEFVDQDAVILSAIGANCGRCFLAEGSWTTLANVQAIIPTSELDARYLYYRVNASDYFTRSGSAQPFIKPSSIGSGWILLPPITTQRTIARILCTVDGLIERTEALIAKQQQIKQGLLHDLFTRGVDEHGALRPPQSEAPELYHQSELGWMPRGWGVKRLGNIAEFKAGHAFRTNDLTEHGTRVVRITNLHRPDFPYWFYDKEMAKDCKVTGGDLLFSWAGVAASIDAYWYDGPDAYLNQHIYNFLVADPDFKRFLFFFLQYRLPDLRQAIEGGAGQLHLSKSKIQAIAVLNPDREEVIRLNEKINALSDMFDKEMAQLEKLRLLKTGLMQDLLTGRVGVEGVMEAVVNV